MQPAVPTSTIDNDAMPKQSDGGGAASVGNVSVGNAIAGNVSVGNATAGAASAALASDSAAISAQLPSTSRSKKKPSPVATIFQSLIFGAAAVAALEGFFALAGVGQQEFLEPDKQLGCKHIPGKVVTWRLEGYSNDRLTNSGLRDVDHAVAKAPGVTRIALLGDSSTEGMQVPLPDTYGRVLERSLNARAGKNKFEVINFACSSYSSGQQLLQYRNQVRQYKPDIVVLLYNRGDSVENVFVPGPSVLSAPRPYFYLDKDGKLQIDNAVLEATSSKLKPNAVLDFLRRNSRIYGVFTETGLVLSLNEPLYRKINRWYTGIASRFEKNDRAGTWTVPYGPQKPMEVTGALIKALAAESGKDGSKFILAMFPNAVGDPEYMQQEAQYEIMARKQGFSYIDLTGPVMNRPDSKSMFLQYHFSSKGHALVAERLQPIVESLVSESQLPAANPQ